MSIKAYLICMCCVAVFAWTAWLVTINTTDPTKTGIFGFAMFYITLSVAILSSSVLIGTVVRMWFNKDIHPYRHVLISLRQSLILTGLFTFSLILAAHNLLIWWVVILLIFIATSIEFTFIREPKH